MYILCASFCPMNTNVMAMEMGDHHDHMAMADHHEGHMDHDMDTSECDNCESNTVDDVAFNILSPVTETPVQSFIPVLIALIYDSNHSIAAPQYHLAAASPPIVPEIVSTIVLRT